VPVQGLEPRT